MSNASKHLAESRTIITNTCRVLQEAQHGPVAFGREAYASSADCYVLLNDATKIFCRALSSNFGETDDTRRWSPALPELLLSHPERCGETLALLERAEFKELSYFQFVEV